MKWLLVMIAITTHGDLQTHSAGDFDNRVDCEIYRSELAYAQTLDGSFPVGVEGICVEYITTERQMIWEDQDILEVPIPKIRG